MENGKTVYVPAGRVCGDWKKMANGKLLGKGIYLYNTDSDVINVKEFSLYDAALK